MNNRLNYHSTKLEQVNQREKQLFQQANPRFETVLQPNQSLHEKKIALQKSSFNPLTGEMIQRNLSQISIQNNAAPFGMSPQNAGFETSACQIGQFHSPQINNKQPQRRFQTEDRYKQKQPQGGQIFNDPNTEIQNDPEFQRNLVKFFAADDPNKVKPVNRSNLSDENGVNLQQDEHFQKNLIKFFGADDTNPVKQPYRSEEQLKKLEQDPNFQKNMNKFYGVEAANKAQQQIAEKSQPIFDLQSRQQRIIAITDSCSSVTKSIASFFRTRGIEDYDSFSVPGGISAIENNPIWQDTLKNYLDIINKSYIVKEIYLISVLDNNSNAKLLFNINDKRSHAIAIENVKKIIENILLPNQRINGIVVDQRGASEKVF